MARPTIRDFKMVCVLGGGCSESYLSAQLLKWQGFFIDGCCVLGLKDQFRKEISELNQTRSRTVRGTQIPGCGPQAWTAAHKHSMVHW